MGRLVGAQLRGKEGKRERESEVERYTSTGEYQLCQVDKSKCYHLMLFINLEGKQHSEDSLFKMPNNY